MGVKLYKIQRDIVEWLAENDRLLLCDEAGLGKSASIIAGLTKNGRKQILVIGTKTGIIQFEKEVRLWSKFQVYNLYRDSITKIINDPNPKFVLSSYSGYNKLIPLLKRWKPDSVVFDEIHNLRNRETKAFQFYYKLTRRLPYNVIIAGLTATPIVNKDDDIISIKDILRGRKYKNRKIGIEQWLIRREKKSIRKKFPILDIEVVSVDQNREQRWLNSNNRHRGWGRTTYSKLVDISPRLMSKTARESYKMELTLKILRKVVNSRKQKVIVFSQYRTSLKYFIKEYQKELKGGYVYIDGSLSIKKRQDIIKEFSNNPKIKVLYITLKTGGEALSIPQANNIVMMDLWWTYASLYQGLNRIHRITQSRDCKVWVILTKGIDIGVLKRVAMKEMIARDSLNNYLYLQKISKNLGSIINRKI